MHHSSPIYARQFLDSEIDKIAHWRVTCKLRTFIERCNVLIMSYPLEGRCGRNAYQLRDFRAGRLATLRGPQCSRRLMLASLTIFFSSLLAALVWGYVYRIVSCTQSSLLVLLYISDTMFTNSTAGISYRLWFCKFYKLPLL